MLKFSDLNPELLNPGSDQTVFEATIDAHGTDLLPIESANLG
ncbi:hypothetical protein [Celeribacter baekdonensis]|tara:strand:+ start:175068 stop:175193 length:126 start_codon:yes stop_codon:yes gene_type:complete